MSAPRGSNLVTCCASVFVCDWTPSGPLRSSVRPGCPVTVPADPLCSRQSDERPQGLEFGHLLRLGFCLRLDALGAAAELGPPGVPRNSPRRSALQPPVR